MEAPGLFSYKAVFLGVESVTLGKEDHYRTRKSECYSGRKVPKHRHLHTVTSGPSKQSGGAVLSVIRVWGKTFRSHRKMHQENKSPLSPPPPHAQPPRRRSLAWTQWLVMRVQQQSQNRNIKLFPTVRIPAGLRPKLERNPARFQGH